MTDRQTYKPFWHKNIFRTKAGFTLAEVLVTLAIIGIVAALTIPSLVQNIQNNQWKSAFKKNFSIINQVTLQIKEANGGNMINAFEAIPFDGWSDFDKIPATYGNYMNVIKTCRKWESLGNCWASSFQYLNGLTTVPAYSFNVPTGGFAGVILNDGTFLNFAYAGTSGQCNGASWTINDICARIMVDVNGFRAPNTWGKDIYGIYVRKNVISPMGVNGDENTRDNLTCDYNDTSAENLGVNCATKFLTE